MPDIVMKGLAMEFTMVWMCNDRALALGSGGRSSAAKSRALNAISTRISQCFLLFSTSFYSVDNSQLTGNFFPVPLAGFWLT